MKSLKCMVYNPDTGNNDYDQERNPLLIHNLSSSTYLFRSWIRQGRDNSRHATPAAAKAFADCLAKWERGIPDDLKYKRPQDNLDAEYSLAAPELAYGYLLFGRVTWSDPMQLIARPDGETLPAGLIGYNLGNEAVCASESVRDGEILKVLGYSEGAIRMLIDPCRDGHRPWLSDLLFDAAA